MSDQVSDKLTKRLFIYLVPIVLGAWIVLTVAVDFIAIPTVFRTLQDINLGGSVGIELFPKVNKVEMILASLLLIGILYKQKVKEKMFDRFILIQSFFLFLLSFAYSFFLSPEIKRLTLLIQSKSFDVNALADLQIQHSFYHHLYIKLEGVKLIFLLMMMAWCFFCDLKMQKVAKSLEEHKA